MPDPTSNSIDFDRAAGYYDETRGFPPGVGEDVARFLRDAGGLGSTERVLEVGVGTGRIALPLASYVGRYTGLDLSRPMMARLRTKPDAARVQLVEGDATRLPFPTHSFDAAVAVHVFHLIPPWQAAVQELVRVLTPAGRLLHAWTDGDDSFGPIWNAYRAHIPPRHGVQHGTRYEDRDRFLTDSGWHLQHEDHLTYTQAQAPQTLIDRLERRVWSRTWTVSDDDLARAVAAARDAAKAHFADPALPVATTVTFRVQVYTPPR